MLSIRAQYAGHLHRTFAGLPVFRHVLHIGLPGGTDSFAERQVPHHCRHIARLFAAHGCQSFVAGFRQRPALNRPDGSRPRAAIGFAVPLLSGETVGIAAERPALSRKHGMDQRTIGVFRIKLTFGVPKKRKIVIQTQI